MNRHKHDIKFSAPKYGAQGKKGVGQDGFRQARKDHRSDTDASGTTDAGTGADTSPRVGSGVVSRASLNNYVSSLMGPVTYTFASDLYSYKPPALPVEQSTEAVQAWKVARLYSPDGRTIILGAVNQMAVHPVEGDALCLRSATGATFVGPGLWIYDDFVAPNPQHVVPDQSCSCGFYAWKTRNDAQQFCHETNAADMTVIMQVELFGKVIQFEKGFRAQSQRVLGIALPPTCSGMLCGKPAQVINFPNPGRDSRFQVLCAAHTPEQSISVVRLADISNALGCEVTWASA